MCEIFKANSIHPNVRFTVKDDYAIILMVESGLGISILPELVLHRTPLQNRQEGIGHARLPKAGYRSERYPPCFACRQTFFGLSTP